MASTNPYKVLHLQLIKNSPNNWKFSYNLISISYKKNCFYLRIAFYISTRELTSFTFSVSTTNFPHCFC